MKILIVEDEPKVASFIKQGLEEQSYEVTWAEDGAEGKVWVGKETFDTLIIDVNIPKINGLELCKIIREKSIQTPILMLTALGTTEDKLEGFEAGVDDYLVKPFEFRELLARLRALQKRNNDTHLRSSHRIMSVADLELDLDEKVAKRGGNKIDLTAKEFLLLEFFIKNKGKVVSRSSIAENVWEINFDTGTNVIDVYVNFLRKKLDKDYSKKLIHTVVGMGYILKEN